MNKIFTSLLVALACCTAIIAAVQTELRMHIFQEGDKGESYHVVGKVDSVKFTLDTLEFRVSFVDWNGTELQSGILQSGATPKYEGKEPTREQTAKYTYDFKGWNPEIAEVQKEAVYTAEYDSTERVYTCIFNDYDGNELEKVENTYDYVPGSEPTRTEDDYSYTFKGWSLDDSQISDNILIYTAEYDSTFIMKKNGAIRTAYKVSEEDSVYFSQGNLQFNAVQGTHAVYEGTEEIAGTWRFAENQYDYVGKANSNISESYDGWIDLFGWGTGLYPTKSSPSYSDYGSFTDWGVNAISNGGNEPNKWRTLTVSEWQYLFKNNKWTLGYIKDGDESHLCFMLIPESFTAPEGTTVTVLSTSTTSTSMSVSVPSGNTYTAEQFASLERMGVVALPCGGYRYGATMYGVGSSGYYWSSSALNTRYAYEFYFYSMYVDSSYSYRRSYGRSVRLVQDL